MAETSKTARIRRAETHISVPAYLGDLVFPGDALQADNGIVSVSYCPANALYSISAGEMLAGEKRLLVNNQEPPIVRRIPCRLPVVGTQTYRDVSAGADRIQASSPAAAEPSASSSPPLTADQTAELASLNTLVARDPTDITARLARAMALEAANDISAAVHDYQVLSQLAPKAGWVADELNALIARRDRLPAGAGKIVAVVVGISDYQNSQQFENLQFADRDALYFYDYLTSPRGGARPADVTLLLNEQAKLDPLQLAVQEAFARARPQDKVVLFIAAHGIPIDEGPNRGAYIAAYNGDLNDPAKTMFRMDDLQKVTTETLRPEWVQIYADTCHAALIGGIDTRKENLFLADFMSERRKDIKVLGLLASKENELAYECSNLDYGHGAFTYFLVKGLNSDEALDDSHQITVDSLYQYVLSNVKAWTKDLKPKQTPFMRSPNDISSEIVARPDLPGLSVGPPSGPHNCESSRGLSVPKLPVQAGSGLHDWNAQAIAAQLNSGQEVLLHYLQGEAQPMNREDFFRGETFFAAASKLQRGADSFTEARLLFCTGRKLIFDKNYPQAIDALEESIRKDPFGAYSYNALGIAFLETADFAKAVQAFQDAIRLAPYWAYARHNLALALAQAGQYAPAIVAYRQAMKLGPAYSYIPFNLGLLYERLNRPDEARSLWFQVGQTSPGMTRTWNAIGLSYALEGQRTKAEAYYRKALAMASDTTDRLAVRHNLALLLVSRHREDEALLLWGQNLNDVPDDLPSLVGMSEALYSRGDTAAATRTFVQLLKDKPDFSGARLQYARLLAKSGKDAASAAAQLKTILEKAPNNSDASELLADLLANSLNHGPSDTQEALKLYAQARDNAASHSQRSRIKNKESLLTSRLHAVEKKKGSLPPLHERN